MTAPTVAPGSAAWLAMITPSKVAAIVGESRYESPFRLWCRMKGWVPPEPPKEAFDIGHDAEPFAANIWRRQPGNEGWLLSRGEVEFTVPAEHFGFPASVHLDRRAVYGAFRRVVEFKVARTLSDIDVWGDDLTGDCPLDYAIQVIVQRLFAAAAQPRLGWMKHDPHLLAIGPYLNHRLYILEQARDPSVSAWLIDECQKFYASLQSDTPPPLDDTPQTYECLRELHPDIDGTVVELDRAAALDYLEAVHAEKAAKTAKTGAASRLLDTMRLAKYAVVKRPEAAGGDIRVAERRDNGKGGVSLYSGKASAIDDVRFNREESDQ